MQHTWVSCSSLDCPLNHLGKRTLGFHHFYVFLFGGCSLCFPCYVCGVKFRIRHILTGSIWLMSLGPLDCFYLVGHFLAGVQLSDALYFAGQIFLFGLFGLLTSYLQRCSNFLFLSGSPLTCTTNLLIKTSWDKQNLQLF